MLHGQFRKRAQLKNMEQDITVKIPRGWIKGLPEEELTLKQIIRLGIY